MATTSFGAATASAASISDNAHRSSAYLQLCYRLSSAKLIFRLSNKPKLRFLYKSSWNSSSIVKAQSKEVSVDAASKNAPSSPPKSEASPTKPTTLASEESISEFITQVTDLVKLVDSKDIVELQLKQHDCELLIRKKEALAPPPPPPVQPAVLPPAPGPSPASSAAPSPPPPTKAQAPNSSLVPLKSPMAGNFYRSPGPGEPPFVKVGDKVLKGQVVCIIEAMKLMNEIEADQSGTVVEIIPEDGKPVSVDSPLLLIQP